MTPSNKTQAELREQIIKAVWPYSKPDPISVVFTRGIDERIFQMPMAAFVTSITALIEAQGMMTGEEFYQRFIEEYSKILEENPTEQFDGFAQNAAKRASNTS